MSVKSEEKGSNKEEIIKYMCAHHCGGICLFKAHVKDGVITRLEPDDDATETQLRGCIRGHSLRQQIYAPDRLLYPLKRTGPRGSGQFARISWDEALDTTASELKRIKAAYGNASILYCGGGGNVTQVHGFRVTMERMLNLFGGFSGTWGAMSWESAMFASAANYGTIHVANNRDDLINSRLIIMWAVNPVVTHQSTNFMWYLKQAKEAGAKIISIDPRYTQAAATVADQWIPIIPNTDTAMLLAMAYVMITEKLHDQAFLDRYTIGFDNFKEYVLGTSDGTPKTPEWAAAITGVLTATIVQVARDYATIKPGALISGISPGRTNFGEQFHRATATLAAMTGNVGIHGGEAAGRSHGDQAPYNPYPFKAGKGMVTGENPIDKELPKRHNSIPGYPSPASLTRVHKGKMPDAILKGKAGGYYADYKAFIVLNCNPVNQNSPTGVWVKALDKLEFMVTFEQFMTATARYADIVFPTCTIVERNDLVYGGATPYYGLQKKIIEPRGECKSQLEICSLLAAHLGIDPKLYNDKTDEEWAKQIATGGGDIPDWEAFKEAGVYRMPRTEPHVSFKKQIEDPEHNPFPTPSGKIEIYSQLMADMNDPLLPPIPTYFEPWEGRHSPLAKTYPLQLITVRCQRRSHTQFETLPWLREIVPNIAEINPVDAKARRIKNGDMLRMFNARGEIRIPAKITERIMPGVVSVPTGAWFTPDEKGIDRGACPNTLNSDDFSPCGSFTWNTCLVEVEKAKD